MEFYGHPVLMSNLKSGSQIKTRTTVIDVIICVVSWSPTAECLFGGPLQTRREEDRDSWHNPALGGMSVVIIHTQLWRRRPMTEVTVTVGGRALTERQTVTPCDQCEITPNHEAHTKRKKCIWNVQGILCTQIHHIFNQKYCEMIFQLKRNAFYLNIL